MFAFTIVLWELLHLRQAYADVSPLEIRDSIREGSRLPISNETPEELTTLVTQSWDQNARARPTFSEIVMFLKSFLATNAEPYSRLLVSIKPSAISPASGRENDADTDDILSIIKKKIPVKNGWKQYPLKKKLVWVAFFIMGLILLAAGIVVAVVVTSNRGIVPGEASNGVLSTSSSSAASNASTTVVTTAPNTSTTVVTTCSIYTPPSNRYDCGFPGITLAGCTARNCCWSPLPAGTSGPWCYSIRN